MQELVSSDRRLFLHSRNSPGMHFLLHTVCLIANVPSMCIIALINRKPLLYAGRVNIAIAIQNWIEARTRAPIIRYGSRYDKSRLQFALYYLQYCFLRNLPFRLSLPLPPPSPSAFIPITPRPRGNRSPPLSDDTTRRFYV